MDNIRKYTSSRHPIGKMSMTRAINLLIKDMNIKKKWQIRIKKLGTQTTNRHLSILLHSKKHYMEKNTQANCNTNILRKSGLLHYLSKIKKIEVREDRMRINMKWERINSIL